MLFSSASFFVCGIDIVSPFATNLTLNLPESAYVLTVVPPLKGCFKNHCSTELFLLCDNLSLYDSVAFAEAEPTISMVISPPSDKILSILGINDFFIKSKLPSTTSVKKFGTDDPENSSEPILTFCGACCEYVCFFPTY